MRQNVKTWLKIALTILTPSFRFVNASLWETFVGPHGPPNGGFCAFWPLVYYKIVRIDGPEGTMQKLKQYTAKQWFVGALTVLILGLLTAQIFIRIISL